MTDQFKREIFDLIIEDDLQDAFNKLQDGLSSSDPAFIDVASLKGRFRTMEKQLLRGTISAEKATLDRNKISEQLMLLVQKLEVKVKPETETPTSHNADYSAPPTNHQPQYTAPDQPAISGIQGYGQPVTYDGSPSARRTEFELRLPYGMAFDRCLSAFHQAGFPIQSMSKENGIIQARISGNLITSFGERVIFWITGFEGNLTQVVLISDSLNPLMVFDWGRNQGNIDKVMALL